MIKTCINKIWALSFVNIRQKYTDPLFQVDDIHLQFACWPIKHVFICFKINLFKTFFQEVSNILNVDKAQHFDGLDLGPNSVQILSSFDKIRPKQEKCCMCLVARKPDVLYQESLYLTGLGPSIVNRGRI